MREPKIALVFDILDGVGMRGGEKVLEGVSELYPRAPIYCLYHKKGSKSSWIESRKIVTSFIQLLPGEPRYYLPLFPLAIRMFDLRGYDLVISFSSMVARQARTRSGTHISYCFSPIRCVWYPAIDPRLEGYPWIIRAPLKAWLRFWDLRAKVDHNPYMCQEVQKRMKECYGDRCDRLPKYPVWSAILLGILSPKILKKILHFEEDVI